MLTLIGSYLIFVAILQIYSIFKHMATGETAVIFLSFLFTVLSFASGMYLFLGV